MKLLVLFSLCFFIFNSAYAQTLGRVGTARVTKGLNEIEGRLVYLSDDEGSAQDDRFQTRLHYDYGFTDWYALRLITTWDDRRGDSFESEELLNIENRFHHIKREDHGFDFGTRLNLIARDGDKTPHIVLFGFFQEFPLENGDEIRLNQIFGHQVGANSQDGISLDLRAHYMHQLTDDYKLGFEIFSDLENLNEQAGYSAQEHAMGPIFKGKMPYNLDYEIGYRLGVSKAAPDHAFRLFVGQQF